MDTTALTETEWQKMVAAEIVPAFPGQLRDTFPAHADWVFRKVSEAGWSAVETLWTLREVARTYRQLDNLWAILNHSHDGQKDREGNTTGGWVNSDTRIAGLKAANETAELTRMRDHCYATFDEDLAFAKVKRCKRGRGYCGDCPGTHRPRRRDRAASRRGWSPPRQPTI